jgi:hypothetical protein
LDLNCQRIWRNGTRPTVLVGHDFTYLTTKSKALCPYISSVTVNQQISQTVSFSQGSCYFKPNINGTGDSETDDIVGHLTHHSAQQLYRPFDINLHTLNLCIAAAWAEQGYWMHDERYGLIPVVNQTTYPNFAAPVGSNAQWSTFVPQQSYGGPITVPVGAQGGADDGGDDQYIGSNHSPCPQVLPYLKTGDHIWVEQLVNDFNKRNLGNFYGVVTVGAVTGYKLWAFAKFNSNNNTDDGLGSGGRGMGWALRSFGFALHFMPSGRPEKQYMVDQMSLNAQVAAACPATFPAGAQALGNFSGLNKQPTGEYDYAAYFDDIQFWCWALEAWRGEYPGWLSFITNYFVRRVPGRFDEAGSPQGSIFCANQYQIAAADSSYNFYTTWTALYTATSTTGQVNAQYTQTGNLAASNATITALSGGGGSLLQGQYVQDLAFGDFPYGTTLAANQVGSTVLAGAPSANNRTGVTLNFANLPLPFPGIPTIISQFPDTICPTPGAISPYRAGSFVNMSTSALAMAAVLGIPRAASIYTEIRRRQYANGLDFTSFPKYAIGPIGAAN